MPRTLGTSSGQFLKFENAKWKHLIGRAVVRHACRLPPGRRQGGLASPGLTTRDITPELEGWVFGCKNECITTTPFILLEETTVRREHGKL